ncbi:hypothetical protein [Iningainema tapete]|uniref:Uncharacterized protein n=1 Tax=Iningainema tapete BLCC-T55 TaxID=2748662 RepID=A0A8J7C4Z4_9CYAN|nr:hypothetical protein [Iningainema tapete]MBD2772304.1 hypothetical protein [Iningainema tapete BLCC-T55]
MTIALEAQGITITLKRILELLEAEDEDDYGILKPTDYAFKTALSLVSEAYSQMGDTFPKATASTDHEGGIRLAWTSLKPERTVRLFCPSSSEKPVDIYHSTSDEYAVEDVVSVSTLVNWLQWFNKE